MVERDVVLAKIALIDRALARVRETGTKNLDSVDAEEILVLNIQRASQAAIDLAAHVVSSEGWRLPDSLGENFTILAEHGVIPTDLAGSLRSMAGFRNVAVHTYEQIDPRIVDRIVDYHLDELRQLASHVLTTFDIT